MTPEPAELRRKCLLTLQEVAGAIWPDRITNSCLSGKELDTVLLRVQSDASKRGLNNVWAAKMRLLAKSAVTEQ